MKPAAVAAWRSWNQPNEGWTLFPYTDAIGLLTVGMGNMIDASRGVDGAGLPWTIGGAPAGRAAAQAQLDAVKAAWPGVQSLACSGLSSIRLTDADVLSLIDRQIAANEIELRKSFPGWDTFPADGQAALMSKAWAMGPGFVPAYGFHRFAALVNAGQWKAAIPEGHYRGAGTAGRQKQEDVAMLNADAVVNGGGSPDTLYWPGAASGFDFQRAGELALVVGGLLYGLSLLFPADAAAVLRRIASWA